MNYWILACTVLGSCLIICGHRIWIAHIKHCSEKKILKKKLNREKEAMETSIERLKLEHENLLASEEQKGIIEILKVMINHNPQK